MKLDFTILWIDDTPSWVRPVESSLKQYLDELGFRLHVQLEKSGENILEAAKNPELDLILIDYRLPKKRTGEILINEIRGQDILQDIIFYSQEGSPRDKFQMPPDGVYFTAREDAEGRIRSIIDLKIKQATNVTNVRGWIIAETIDLEVKLGEILTHCFGDKGDLFRERFLKHDGLFDFGKKFMVINGILSDRIAALNQELQADPRSEKAETLTKSVAAMKELKEIYKAFEKEVIQPRNTMAHVEKYRDEKGNIVLRPLKNSYPAIVLGHDWCKKTRRNLIKHMDNLERILGII